MYRVYDEVVGGGFDDRIAKLNSWRRAKKGISIRSGNPRYTFVRANGFENPPSSTTFLPPREATRDGRCVLLL